MKLLASLALGIALGVVAALYLVFWRSGAEPDAPPVTGENAVLLRRLDGWRPGDHDTGPLIRWAAAHLRGELAEPDEPAVTEPAGLFV